MAFRTRHPQSLPPPAMADALITPPTSPEISPLMDTFTRTSAQPAASSSAASHPSLATTAAIASSKQSPTRRVLRRKKSGLGSTIRTKKSRDALKGVHEVTADKENAGAQASASNPSVAERLVKRVRNVKSVPLLNNTNRYSSQQQTCSVDQQSKSTTTNRPIGKQEFLVERKPSRHAASQSIGGGAPPVLGRYHTEFSYPSSGELDGRFELPPPPQSTDSLDLARSMTSNTELRDTRDHSISLTGTNVSHFGSVSSCSWNPAAATSASTMSGSQDMGRSSKRQRSETVTTFGGNTSTSLSGGSPRSTIRVDLGIDHHAAASTSTPKYPESMTTATTVSPTATYHKTPGTDSTVRATGDTTIEKSDVYRRSRQLQRIVAGFHETSDSRDTGAEDQEVLVANWSDEHQGDTDSMEEIRETEEMQQRFLKRHSRDFAHLHSFPGQAYSTRDAPETTTIGHDSPALRAFNLDESEQDRQARIIEESKTAGREKRRSWMLAKAGLLGGGGPLSPTAHTSPITSLHRRNGSVNSASPMSPVFSPQLGRFQNNGKRASIDATPRASVATPGGERRNSRSGIRPLSLVISQEHARSREKRSSLSFTSGDLGPLLNTTMSAATATTAPAVASPVVLEEEEDEEDGPPRDWSTVAAPPLGRRLSKTTKRHSYVRSSVDLSPAQQALPPYLRSYSQSISTHSHHSQTSNSSMSSLGAVIGGTANSESSCSSGAEHLGGPRVLSAESFNFRMSLQEKRHAPHSATLASYQLGGQDGNGRSESRNTFSSFAMGSVRTDSRLTLRGPTPDLRMDDAAEMEDRDARIKRRRARAFLVAGLKLENNTLQTRRDANQDVVVEHEDECEEETSGGRKNRRGGIMVEENLGIGQEHVSSPGEVVPRPVSTARSTPVERKRYSVMRREKVGSSSGGGGGGESSPEVGWSQSLPIRRAGTPLLPFYLAKPTTSVQQDSDQREVLRSEEIESKEAAAPEITISVTEDLENVAPPGEIQPSDAAGLDPLYAAHSRALSVSPQDTNSTVDNGDIVRELFWLPGAANPMMPGSSTPHAPQQNDHVVRKVKSDVGLGASFRDPIPNAPGRSMSRPPSPLLVHGDSAGASPARDADSERKSSWSTAARGWLRSETKITPEVEMEKGFGHGRGGDNQNTPQTYPLMNEVDVPSTPTQPSKEKKSWKALLGGAKGKRRGSLPKTFRADKQPFTEQPQAISLPEQAHVRQSTGPSSRAYSVAAAAVNSQQQHLLQTPSPTMLPPAFPSINSRNQINHFSPLSAASSSPQTPEYLMTSPGMRADHRLPRVLHNNNSKYPRHNQVDILSPTPQFSQSTEGNGAHSFNRFNKTFTLSEPSSPTHHAQSSSTRYDPHHDTLPLRPMTSNERLFGLGLDPVHGGDHQATAPMTPWKGKARACDTSDQQAWSRHFEHQAVALVRLSNQKNATPLPGTSTCNLTPTSPGLGSRPNLGIGAKPLVSQHYEQPTFREIANSPVQPYFDQQTVDASHPQQASGDGAKQSRHAPPSPEQKAMLLKHDTRILPAKVFFMLGFFLGPWLWLLGGWGLSPAGHHLRSTHVGIRPTGSMRFASPHQRTNDSSSSSSNHDTLALPPFNRDKPEKWVKRNRLAAVVSSAVFIPAFCVGFGYLGHLL